jgi:hypothetical protein
MPWYEYKGQKIEAQTPEAAKALIRNRLEGGEVDPTEGMSGMDKFLAGAGSGAMNVLRQTGNMLGMVDDEALAEQRRIDAPLMATGAGQAGRLAGEVGAVLPAGMGAGAVARGVLGQGARMLPAMAEGATEGAILAGPDERGAGAGMGGGIGGAMGLGARALRRTMGSTDVGPGAQMLQREGVNLMPGRAQQGGMLKAMEESAAGRLMPGVAEARQINVDDAVRLMMKRAAPSRAAREAVELNRGGALADDLDNLYGSFEPIYAQVRGYPAKLVTQQGQRLDSALLSAAQRARGTNAVRESVTSFIDDELSGLVNKAGKQLQSDDLLELRSRIRERIRQRQRTLASDPDEVLALEQLEDIVSDALENQLPDMAKGLLRRADKQYAKYKTVEDVVGSRGDMPMTRNAISRGITKAEERMAGRGGMARGSDYTGMRDIGQAAAEAFEEGTSKTGMSLLLPGLTTGIGGSVGGPLGMALGAAAGGVVPSVAAVSQGARRAMMGETKAQRALANTMDAIRDPVGRFARAGAVGYASQE